MTTWLGSSCRLTACCSSSRKKSDIRPQEIYFKVHKMWKRVKNKLNKIGAGTIKKKHYSKRPIPLKTTQAHIATGVLYTAWHYIHDTGSSVFFFAQHFGATALFIRLLACPAKLELRQPEKMPTTDRRSQGPNHMQMFSFWRPMAWLALRRWPTQSWSLNINVNSKCCKKKT